MAYEFGLAESAEDRAAVFAFRYTVYVEEMGRYQDTADHEHRWLVEPEDDHSWISYVRDGNEIVATGRLTWGGERFSERQVRQYGLAPFLAELPHEALAVGERLMVSPKLRGSGLVDELMLRTEELTGNTSVRLLFGACEPHLLSLYLGLGARTYAPHNINTPEAGYLIPIVNFPHGIEGLRELGDAEPPCIREVLTDGGAVRSGLLSSSDEYRAEVHETLTRLEQGSIGAFDGFSAEEEDRCLARSNIIDCDAGDHVLKKGGSARNVFVVLDGTLEVRDDERVVGVLTRGDVFGEMAFLLERPRSQDVYAATDATRVLSLSEGTLRKMIAEDAEVAAKLLLNLSKMLCARLIKAN